MSPLYVLMIGISGGLGAGVNSLLSRCLGAQRYEEIDNIVIHALIITVAISIPIMIIGVVGLDDIINLLNASEISSYCRSYGEIIFLCNIVFLLSNVFASVFRAEGYVGKATIPFILTSILNIVLDPILIYTFNLGVFGASLATVLSYFLGILVMLYWILVKKDTSFKFKFKKYVRNIKIYKNILSVSIPSATQEVVYGLTIIVLNLLIIITSNLEELYAFGIAWKIISIAFFPCMGVGTAAITVAGILYGARNPDGFKQTILYSTLLSLTLTLLFCSAFYIFSYQICSLFTALGADVSLINSAAEIVRYMVFFNCLISLGSMAEFIYQGIGQGLKSLALTILREIILCMFGAYLMGIIFKMSVFGVYSGAILGINLGSIFGFICILIYNWKFEKEIEEQISEQIV